MLALSNWRYGWRASLVLVVATGMSPEDTALLNQEQLAALLGFSERTLERRRSEHLGPPFVRLVGRGSVRNRKADVDNWLEDQLVRPSQSYVRVQGSERHHASWSSRMGRYLHLLRHSCGYYLSNRGTELRLTQDFLGHRDPKHTMRYAHVAGPRFEGLLE